jgi:hypothetical protein
MSPAHSKHPGIAGGVLHMCLTVAAFGLCAGVAGGNANRHALDRRVLEQLRHGGDPARRDSFGEQCRGVIAV